MKSIILIMVLGLFAICANAQTGNLDALPKVKRDSLLIEVAKEAALKYAPEWYRNEVPPLIEVRYTKKTNRKFYSVTFYADRDKDPDAWPYQLRVSIWENTGKTFQINFPYNQSISGLDKRVETRGEKTETSPFIPKPKGW